ncbi:MAG: tetratricopeptide repeat protein [Chitinophagaceae bacterium]|nr:MAG: tetratricopeptide repeat protein [Chitinophagaceae bacterium]
MNKKLTAFTFFIAALLFAGSAVAQSLEDGKKFMYYERFKSAKDVFQKLAASGDEEATYWLGQAEIGLENIPAAKSVYQAKLSASPNSPLILAGMGHVELLEGKSQDARSRFETAISLSQGKNLAVLNAVGFANSNPDNKNGDAQYAIQKLNQATQLKKMNDPSVWTNLGDAYRKAGQGGDAVKSYTKALELDPNYARAIYRMGSVYQSQGPSQEALYTKYYNDAIAKDPKYAPVYATLWASNYETNVGKSAEYLDKLLANSDDDPKACYYRASMKYAQGLFAEAVTQVDQCVAAAGATPYGKVFGLKAYALDRLSDQSFKAKDSVKGREYLTNAKASFEEYLKRASADQIGAGDYSRYGRILLKFPGSENQAVEMVMKAVALDTIDANKATYYQELAKAFEAQKNAAEAAKWYSKVLDVKKGFSNVDIYNAGYAFYQASKYDSTIKYFTLYTEKYPKDIFGYYMLGNANAVIDSNSTQGLAAPFYKKVIEIGEADLTASQVKPRLITAYKYFMGYEFNVNKNQAEALKWVDKAIALAPDDANLKANRDFMASTDPKAPAKPAAKPKTGAKK